MFIECVLNLPYPDAPQGEAVKSKEDPSKPPPARGWFIFRQNQCYYINAAAARALTQLNKKIGGHHRGRKPKMFIKNASLKAYSSYKIGGQAKYFFEIKDIDELYEALKLAQEFGEPVFILGGGTNILFPDAGLDAAVIKINLNYVRQEGDGLTVGAGTLMKDLLDYCIENSLSGLEWAGGLPGTLGGAVRGNAGAFAGEIKDSVRTVVSVNIKEPERLIKRSNSESQFSYRSSIFKEEKKNEIILEAKLNMKAGDGEAIKKAIDEKINYRKERQPLEYPNVGSVFKNVDLRLIPVEHLETVKPVMKNDPFPVVPTAFLISECGLKGVKEGGAMISPKHPNFIVNLGNATAADVKKLINLVKEKVYNKFQVKLEEEIIVL